MSKVIININKIPYIIIMKRKAIRAVLRKESIQFPGYFKYELDIQEEDGSITKNVPAYGKDLQDALTRTVNHDKIEKVEKKLKSLPYWFTIGLYTSYMVAMAYTSIKLSQSWPVLVGMGFLLMLILGLQYLTTEKEIND